MAEESNGSEGPPARWQHCMVTTGEHLYILGGSGQGGSILADVYRFWLTFSPCMEGFRGGFRQRLFFCVVHPMSLTIFANQHMDFFICFCKRFFEPKIKCRKHAKTSISTRQSGETISKSKSVIASVYQNSFSWDFLFS